MIDSSFIYSIVNRDHPGIKKDNRKPARHRWKGGKKGFLLPWQGYLWAPGLLVFLFIIWGKFLSFTSIAQLSCHYSNGGKGISDGSRPPYPSRSLFSSKVPKSNSDYLRIYTPKQTGSIEWSPALNNYVTADWGCLSSKETTRERKCLLKCKWILCACSLALLKKKIC